MKRTEQIVLLLLLLSFAAAQDPAAMPVQVEKLRLLRDGNDVRVEVFLTGQTNASVEVATQPDRLVIVLPETVSDAKQQPAAANVSGIRSVRVQLNSANPPVTRVVIELDQARPYTLQSRDTRIILRIQPATSAANRRHGGPPGAAALGSLGAIFHRHPSKPSSASQAQTTAAQGLPAPPPSFPPISLPGDSGASSTAGANTGPQPAASQVPLNPVSQSPSDQSTAPHSAATESVPLGQDAGSTDGVAPAPAVQAQSPLPSLPAPVAPARTPGSTDLVAVTPPTPTSSAVAASAPPAATVAGDATLPALALRTSPDLRTFFTVKYVAQGAAYLDGGRAAGLTEGMKLIVRESTSLPSKTPGASNLAAAGTNDGTVAELQVISVAETSAVTDIRAPTRDLKPGDIAYLSTEDQEALVEKNALSSTRKYPTVISFTEGDTLDEEARDQVPKPPLPSVNRARGALGFDYMGTMTHGAGGSLSSDVGMMVRTDITRIAGTYWNMSGYWRGRLNQQSAPGQPTLQDLINRTYHLAMTYDNPQSAWVAGFGRLYLPWASSLDTIDGGYFGHRFHGTTSGIFAGSTPDPTSWDYSPDRRLAGAFVNFEGGSFDDFRYTSTSGVGVSTLKWLVDRPFVFLENGFFYKRFLSIYDSMQADSPRGTPATPAPGPGIGRSFLTARVMPLPRLELDFNHTYFRDVPTFDPTLIGTGLLDKYLFQGFSAGARVEVVKQIWVYTDLGRSSRSGDNKSSLNQMYGATWERLPWFRLRADAHYSRFNSSFADGTYESFSLSRSFGDFRLTVLAGQQNFTSTFSARNRSRFITSNVEAPLGTHYFLQGGFTTNRGSLMNYDQWMFTLGYRFDSRQAHNDR